jgi:hypothetical protein
MEQINIDSGPVLTLSVFDAERSTKLYEGLFGLTTAAGFTSPGEVLLQGIGPGPVGALRLVEREGATLPVDIAIELETPADVLDLYLLALMLGVRAKLPRVRERRLRTIIVDHDGHRIWAWTKLPAPSGRAPGRHDDSRRSRRQRDDRTDRLHIDRAGERRAGHGLGGGPVR